MASTEEPTQSETSCSKFDKLMRGHFDRNEKSFQARMAKIIEKYDHPFADDIVIHLEDLTYETPYGRRPWKFEMYIPVKAEQCKLGHKPILMQDEENTYVNDHKEIGSTQNRDLRVVSKAIHVASLFKASQQENRLNEMQNMDCFFEDPRSQAEADHATPSYRELANQSLTCFYPQIINKMGSLWDFEIKNQIAVNIVRRYRHLNRYKNKVVLMSMNSRNQFRSVNKTYILCHAPNVLEIPTAAEPCASILFQEDQLSKSAGSPKPGVHSQSLISQVHKLDSVASPGTLHFDSQKNANKTLECISPSQTMFMASPRQKKINGDMSPGYSSRALGSSCKIPIHSKKSQMDADIAQFQYYQNSKCLQQNIKPVIRRNSLSEFPMSPKKVVSKRNCNMSEKPKTLSKTRITKGQMEVDERIHASYKEHIKQLSNRPCTVTRRNSFSAFPGPYTSNQDFEDLYKSLTRDRPQSVFSFSKGQDQLSKTVSSLVNSPGSLRVKRPPSHDFSFSMSKKPRSVAEALICRSKSSPSVENEDLSEHSSSPRLQHLVVASALPAHILPHSSVSRMLFSPRANDESPKRTNARKADARH